MEKDDMDDPKEYGEVNIQKLVQAGMGETAQPDNDVRKELLTRLKAELPAKPVSDFPAAVMGMISAIFAILIFWWMVQSNSLPTWTTNVIGTLIGVNLLCIPVGSIVIVNRRRHV
jgi:hypothetical protein